MLAYIIVSVEDTELDHDEDEDMTDQLEDDDEPSGVWMCVGGVGGCGGEGFRREGGLHNLLYITIQLS